MGAISFSAEQSRSLRTFAYAETRKRAEMRRRSEKELEAEMRKDDPSNAQVVAKDNAPKDSLMSSLRAEVDEERRRIEAQCKELPAQVMGPYELKRCNLCAFKGEKFPAVAHGA